MSSTCGGLPAKHFSSHQLFLHTHSIQESLTTVLLLVSRILLILILVLHIVAVYFYESLVVDFSSAGTEAKLLLKGFIFMRLCKMAACATPEFQMSLRVISSDNYITETA